MVREEQLLKRIQELETENEKLRTQLNRRTSGAVDGAAEQTRAKYADRILDTLPDMMTVWTNSGVITELISSEETNHVGVPSERFIGMNIRELLPEEAYRNVRANLDHVLETKRGSTGRHDLTVDGELRHYENRIWPLDRDKVLCMCRDITARVLVLLFGNQRILCPGYPAGTAGTGERSRFCECRLLFRAFRPSGRP